MPGLGLPTPYPDELIGSVLARAVMRDGLPPKLLVTRVLGMQRNGISVFMPLQVSRLARACRMDSEELLVNHSVFSFATAFISEETAAALKRRILSVRREAPGNAETSLGAIARSAIDPVAPLKYCPTCAAEELRLYGESYWHRCHCLIGASACTVHRLLLSELPHQPKSFSQYLLLPQPHLLQESLPKNERGAHTSKTLVDDRSWQLTSAVQATLQQEWVRRSDWQEQYRERAASTGYCLAGSRIAGSTLTYEMLRFWGVTRLQRLNLSFTPHGRAWPALMVRPGSELNFAPIRHLLLGTFLAEPGHTPTPKQSRPGPKPSACSQLDAAIAAAVKWHTERLLNLGDATTVKQLLTLTGRWELFRHNRMELPLTTAAVQVFRGSDASQRKAGGRPAHAARVQAVAEGRQKPPKRWAERRGRPRHHEHSRGARPATTELQRLPSSD